MEETAALERRLSELPEELNLHILSYYVHQLSDSEAIRFSLLSKKVHCLVQNRPSLVFDFHPKRLEFEEELNYTQSVLQTQNIQLTAALESSLLELPEDINLHILSYHVDQLTNRDAIRLSLLSKQLQHVVQKRRTLVFNIRSILTSPNEPWKTYENKFRDELNYISCTLDRYHRENIQLETFTLIASHYFESWVHKLYYPAVEEGVYNRCIELVAKKGLRYLNLWMRGNVLPQSVFQVESLVELTLENCCLKPERIVAWRNLKRLSIGKEVSGTREAFENIIRGCPSIEYLNFNSHSFTADLKFKVANLCNLKQLYFGLGDCEHRLKVNAALNLESIIIMHCIDSYTIPHNVIDFGRTEYPRLTSIEVTSRGLDENFFINFALRFPMLQKLCIRKSKTLQKIDLWSASLKEIKLIDNETLEEAILDVPNLIHFEYKNRKGGNYKLIPKLTVAGNSGRWSSCIKLADIWDIDVSWFLELNEFLNSLKDSETSVTVEILSGLFKEYPVIANHVIPVRGIREFSLDAGTNSNITKNIASAILDCIFSICQPQTITFVDGEESEFPKLLQEKLESRSSHHYHGVTGFHVSQTCVEEPLSREKKKISFHLEYSFESTPKIKVEK